MPGNSAFCALSQVGCLNKTQPSAFHGPNTPEKTTVQTRLNNKKPPVEHLCWINAVFRAGSRSVSSAKNNPILRPMDGNSHMDLSGTMQGAGGVGGLLAVNDGTASYYPTFDGNGNVSEYLAVAIVNNVPVVSIVAHYEYDAFGNTVVWSGAKVADFSHRFSTKSLDQVTGWYYYGYRYYDPLTGRWTSRDPIEESGGLNLYGFVSNDGVNQWDVLGMTAGLADYFAGIVDWPDGESSSLRSGKWVPFDGQNARDTLDKICKDQFGESFSIDTSTADWSGEYFGGQWQVVATRPLRAAIIIDVFLTTPETIMRGLGNSVLAVEISTRTEKRPFEYKCKCPSHATWANDMNHSWAKFKTVAGTFKWTAVKRKYGYSRVVSSEGA
jgi:RHS repeat-associated protein